MRALLGQSGEHILGGGNALLLTTCRAGTQPSYGVKYFSRAENIEEMQEAELVCTGWMLSCLSRTQLAGTVPRTRQVMDGPFGHDLERWGGLGLGHQTGHQGHQI